MESSRRNGEPDFGPWRARSTRSIAEELTSVAPTASAGVIAVDGRSAGGKTTVAAQLADEVDGAVIVHTDDIAWHHSFFDWTDLLVENVLVPARGGAGVAHRPQAWIERDRAGAIEVPVDSRWVLLEGVGAARRELAPYLDAVVWVQSDFEIARERGIERDGGNEAAREFWDEWMEAELPFLDDQRPWERADIVVNGSPTVDVSPGFLLVSTATPAKPR